MSEFTFHIPNEMYVPSLIHQDQVSKTTPAVTIKAHARQNTTPPMVLGFDELKTQLSRIWIKVKWAFFGAQVDYSPVIFEWENISIGNACSASIERSLLN